MLAPLPSDRDLERYVLGCVLYDPRCLDEIQDLFNPKYFFDPKHMALASAIVRLWRQDPKSITLETLAVEPEVRKANVLVSEMTEYAASIPSVHGVRHAAEKLRDIAVRREAVKLGQELMGLAEVYDREEMRRGLAKALAALNRMSEITTRQDTLMEAREVALEFIDILDKIDAAKRKGVTGIPSGFTDLDAITLGFQPTDLIIMAARPSMGKTALMLHMALNIAFKGYVPVTFSLEMSRSQLMFRVVSNLANIDLQRLRGGKITGEERMRINTVLSQLSQTGFTIDDQASMTVEEIRAKARKVKRERGLDIIFIDYLGFIHGDPRLSRYEQISQNVRELKEIAKDLNVPVVCLAQLNRAVEHRQDKRPMLSDLRESGEIEQTADVVLFLYREDYYEPKGESKVIVEVDVAKHRNGPVGKVQLLFDKSCGRFMDVAKRSEAV